MRQSRRGLFGLSSHLIGGLVITLLSGSGGVAAYVLRSQPTARILDGGAVLLTAGTILSLAGVETHSVLLAGIGTALAGGGFGASTLGCFGSLARLAAPAERGELFAVVYVIAYLAFSVPAVVAGFASTTLGLHSAAVLYGLGVTALSITALAAQRFGTKS